MSDDLVKRLRDWEDIPDEDDAAFRWCGEITDEAADRIEQLEEKLRVAEEALQHYMTHGISESSYYVVRKALAKIREVKNG